MGKRLHTPPSHPTLSKPHGFSSGKLTNCMKRITFTDWQRPRREKCTKRSHKFKSALLLCKFDHCHFFVCTQQAFWKWNFDSTKINDQIQYFRNIWLIHEMQSRNKKTHVTPPEQPHSTVKIHNTKARLLKSSNSNLTVKLKKFLHHTHKHAQTCTHACTHTHMHARTHAHMHACTHTYTHTHTHTNKQTNKN